MSFPCPVSIDVWCFLPFSHEYCYFEFLWVLNWKTMLKTSSIFIMINSLDYTFSWAIHVGWMRTRVGRKWGSVKFQIGHGQNMFHLTLLNKCAFSKKNWSGSSDPTITSDPLFRVHGKDQNLKIWIMFLPWSKCIHSYLKKLVTCIPFKQKLDMIYRPQGHVLIPKWLILVQNGHICHVWQLWGT